jgi:hypothetical protein
VNADLAVTPARVLWRHWPVLVSLAAAGLVGRVVLVNAAAGLAGVNATVGLGVLLLAPLAVLAAVVVMLRVIRPSLGVRESSPPGLPYLGSALMPFVVFYLAYGLEGEDLRRYIDHLPAGRGPGLAAGQPSLGTLVLLGAAVLTYGLRWLLTGWGRPRLAGPAVYLETLWITLGLLYVIRPYAMAVWGWVEQRAAWRGLVGWWDGVRGAPGLRTANGWLVDAIPGGFVAAIFVVPLAALLAACVVLGITGRPTRPEGIGQHRTGGPVNRPYEPLMSALRAVRRTGMVPLMAFCLAVTALETGIGWLRYGEARLIGPYEPGGLVAAYQPSIDVANRVVALVLLVALLGTGADLVARHQVDAPPAVAEPATTTPARPTAPPPEWPLPQPAWAGPAEGTLAPPAWPGEPPPTG